MAGVAGLVTGLVDALVEEWSIKAFLWAGALLLYALVVAYELTVMDTPPRPLLQASLLVVFSTAGLLSIHHVTWLTTSVMLGRAVEQSLWLAPNIYASTDTYNAVMAISLVSYLSYLLYTNKCSGD
jgi:hypothetical protein